MNSMAESRRNPKRQPVVHIPNRVLTLFHNDEPVTGSKNIEIIHKNPNIFIYKNFLSAKDIEYLDNCITAELENFEQSYTENDGLDAVFDEDRTSSYIHFDKGQGNDVASRYSVSSWLIFLHLIR